MNSGIPHFEEGESTSTQKFLPPDVYGLALDSLVIACVDLAILWESKILLGKRKMYPRQGWWLIGGRMFVGESPEQTAVRKAVQEAHLKLTHDRLRYVGAYSTRFAQRSQPPQENGLHSLNLTYQVVVTTEERKQVRLVESEYEDWQWIEREQVFQLLTIEDPIDRALLKVIEDIF